MAWKVGTAMLTSPVRLSLNLSRMARAIQTPIGLNKHPVQLEYHRALDRMA
jgi:hypothetical protein